MIVRVLESHAGATLTSTGVVFLLPALQRFRQAIESARWPTVDAEIISAHVVLHRGRRGHTFYAPAILYRYGRDGVVREGTRLDFGDLWGGPFERSAARRLKDYSSGARVVARVEPRDPRSHLINDRQPERRCRSDGSTLGDKAEPILRSSIKTLKIEILI